MLITHDLLPNQKQMKNGFSVTVDLFPLCTKLYEELEKFNAINRLKEVRQLGMIPVKKKFSRSRYDYVLLQLYLHQIIKKNPKNKLKYSYNNDINNNDLWSVCKIKGSDNEKICSIAEAIQILAFVYNIGHFENTFVSSCAVMMMASENKSFAEYITHSSEDESYQKTVTSLINSKNYHRIHLLNSFLLLERCDSGNRSVQIAKALLMAYLNPSELPEDSKLHPCFELFRKVRTVSYITYDLQIAGIPFIIDLRDKKAMLAFLDEYVSLYNDNSYANVLIASMTKLLGDYVYNEPFGTIHRFQVSKHMMRALCKEENWGDYCSDMLLSPESVLNSKYSITAKCDDQYLKLTFSEEERHIAEQLFLSWDRSNHTLAGYYHRFNGSITLLISIKPSCKEKATVAFHILKMTVSFMIQMGLNKADSRYISLVKYFLYYYFNEH